MAYEHFHEENHFLTNSKVYHYRLAYQVTRHFTPKINQMRTFYDLNTANITLTSTKPRV